MIFPPQNPNLVVPLSAYAAFQRVAVALEVVTKDLRRNQEFALKYGRFWRLAQQAANRAVEATFVLLRAHGASMELVTNADALIRRSSVPPRLRCVRMESRRNIRDWVILRNSLMLADFYHAMLRHFIGSSGGSEN